MIPLDEKIRAAEKVIANHLYWEAPWINYDLQLALANELAIIVVGELETMDAQSDN